MKYVCYPCGIMLRVDKDIDDDRSVEAAIAHHRAYTCPGKFDEAVETPWRYSYKYRLAKPLQD